MAFQMGGMMASGIQQPMFAASPYPATFGGQPMAMGGSMVYQQPAVQSYGLTMPTMATAPAAPAFGGFQFTPNFAAEQPTTTAAPSLFTQQTPSWFSAGGTTATATATEDVGAGYGAGAQSSPSKFDSDLPYTYSMVAIPQSLEAVPQGARGTNPYENPRESAMATAVAASPQAGGGSFATFVGKETPAKGKPATKKKKKKKTSRTCGCCGS